LKRAESRVFRYPDSKPKQARNCAALKALSWERLFHRPGELSVLLENPALQKILAGFGCRSSKGEYLDIFALRKEPHPHPAILR
jgi:hypothetical protein